MTQPHSSSHREPLIPPPRFLTRWYAWALAAIALLVPFFVTIPVGLRRHPVIGPLGDQLHIPLLGAIMLVLYWKGPLRGRLWGATATAAIIGGLIEFIQIYVGRAALLHDWYMDLVGIGIVTGFVLWRGRGSRPGLVLMAALLLFIPWNLRDVPGIVRGRRVVTAQFPLLDRFEDPRTRPLWEATDGAGMAFTRVEDGPDGPTGVLEITGEPTRTWPGAKMGQFPWDWSAYSRLVVRLRHTGPDTSRVTFRLQVDDFAGRMEDAHFSQSFQAGSHWGVFSLPLAGRRADKGDHVIDLREVASLYIHLTRPARPETLQVEGVWVE